MSHVVNTKWIDAMTGMFEEAQMERDLVRMKAVISEMHQYGFDEDASKLEMLI